MRATVEIAQGHDIAIGAHPGFPDLVGFGRRELQVSPADVEDLVVYQIGALAAIVTAKGARLHHVKPHGALYNMAARDPALATAIARAVAAVDSRLVLVGLAGSALIDAGARAGLRTASEVFADRAYDADGSLVSRRHADAIVHDPDRVADRVLQMVTQGCITALDGTRVPIVAETICVHGDTPGAVDVARRIRRVLDDAGIRVAAV
jgi:UPF0271 protein